MKREDIEELGMFEGFNFRDQCAIDRNLTADEVINWDHDKDGEAEFWPDGSSVFVNKLLPGNSCSAGEIQEVVRIFEELEYSPIDLAKAVFLRDVGNSLEDIGRDAIDNSRLYVFGPGWFVDLEKEAAYELFEMFWPEAYTWWEKSNVPGLHFDVKDFISHFPTLEVKLQHGGYLIVDTE
jgi:hypothetical protein